VKEAEKREKNRGYDDEQMYRRRGEKFVQNFAKKIWLQSL
jgi:hypothetical protein